jgi:hypothetical protein
LRKARLAEAAHLDALQNVRDARGLRLLALREAIRPTLQGNPLSEAFQELNLQNGETPRLWIDLISAVVVAPDTRTFRLEQDQDGRRAVLHETTDLDDMARVVVSYIAHRTLARERGFAGVSGTNAPILNGYSLGELVYVWFTGAALGILLFLIAAILMGKLHF